MTVKYIKLLLFLCLALVVLSGCLSAKTKPAHVPENDNRGKLLQDRVTIKASGSYEECIELRPGLIFDYEFEASDFVNFNVHYHAVSGLYYPINSTGVSFGRGTIDPGMHEFYSEEQENYCLMWDNPNDGKVEVSYRGALRKK